MKRILTLLTTLVACCFGYAQSVDVHHSGILPTSCKKSASNMMPLAAPSAS